LPSERQGDGVEQRDCPNTAVKGSGVAKVVEGGVQGPPALEQLLDDYLAACRAKGLSPKTVKLAYGYPLRGVFLPWCARTGIAQPSQLTTRLLGQ